MSCQQRASMAKLKFGSPAWRKKYLKNGPKRKRKSTARRTNKKRASTKRRTPAVRSNPPRKWTKVKAVRVIRRGGKDILEIKR